MSDRVTVSRDESGVADVRLSRPDKLNALDLAMFEALVETGGDLAGDASLRAVVLSGEGRAFSAGLDVMSFAQRAPGGRSLLDLYGEGPATWAQQAAYTWMQLPVPVVAAVHGVCFGGGLQIALAADVRFVAPDARLSVMEIKWGLVPDMTGTQTLRRLVRLDVARELTYTGREVRGTEAVELGLATHLSDDPHAAALELAREIAGRSPSAIRAAKRLLDQSGVVPPAEGLALEAALQRTVMGGPNQVEAVRSNVEKREPRFRDPE